MAEKDELALSRELTLAIAQEVANILEETPNTFARSFVSKSFFNERHAMLMTFVEANKKRFGNAGISGKDMIEEINRVLGTDWQTGGGAAGDMLKSVYDADDDGKVEAADAADSVPWTGVTAVPITIDPSGNVTGMGRTEQDQIAFIKTTQGIKLTTDGSNAGALDVYLKGDAVNDNLKIFHGVLNALSFELDRFTVICHPNAESTSITTGGFQTKGGAGIAKNTNIGGDLTVTGIINKSYAEIYFDNNSVAQVMETANSPMGVLNFTVGDESNWGLAVGYTRAITAYADYSGTVAGTVKVTTSSNHAFFGGEMITQRGSTNYNGLFQTQAIDQLNYYITHSWDGDDGASNLDRPSELGIGLRSTRKHLLRWSFSVRKAAGTSATVKCTAYVNGIAQSKSIIEEELPDTDVKIISGGAIITISTGSRVFLTVESTNTDNITFSRGSLTIVEI